MADKTKTIKNATDKELDELLIRLRKENDAQDLIRSLKRKSTAGNPYDLYSQDVTVSTEQPIESMYHYGIPGMHWGRRTRRTMQIDKSSEDHKTKKDLSKKKLHEMSNQELKALTSRLQLEKQYKDLTRRDSIPGKKFVSEVIGNAAKQTATNYISKYMSKGMEELIKAMMK